MPASRFVTSISGFRPEIMKRMGGWYRSSLQRSCADSVLARLLAAATCMGAYPALFLLYSGCQYACALSACHADLLSQAWQLLHAAAAAHAGLRGRALRLKRTQVGHLAAQCLLFSLQALKLACSLLRCRSDLQE